MTTDSSAPIDPTISVGDRFRTRDKGWLTILQDRGHGYFAVRHSDAQSVNQTWADVRFEGADCHHAYFGRWRWWDLIERDNDVSPAVKSEG